MAAKNDITGDSIRSKHSSAYADNFDSIFRKPAGGMNTSVAETVGSDKPQNGDQRLNNLGQLERYYGGQWNATEQKEG